MSQVIETIKEKTADIYRLFNTFADILINQIMWIKGSRMDIMQLGSRGKLCSNFQVKPSAGAEFIFKVTFDISNDIIKVLYEYRIEFSVGYMPYKMAIKRMVKKELSPQIVSFIKMSLNEAKKKMKEEPITQLQDTPTKEDIKYCIKCGHQNLKNSLFCIDCGNKFPES